MEKKIETTTTTGLCASFSQCNLPRAAYCKYVPHGLLQICSPMNLYVYKFIYMYIHMCKSMCLTMHTYVGRIFHGEYFGLGGAGVLVSRDRDPQRQVKLGLRFCK